MKCKAWARNAKERYFNTLSAYRKSATRQFALYLFFNGFICDVKLIIVPTKHKTSL